MKLSDETKQKIYEDFGLTEDKISIIENAIK